MAVAFDAASRLTTTSSTVDGSWTHTPVGTPAGVAVLITQGAAVTDQVVGVTYGGVAMTRQSFQSQAGGGDPTAAYVYTLTSNVPAGAQTVAVDINAANNYAATAVTVTADSDIAAIDIGNSGNGTATNPTLTLDYTDGLATWVALVCFAEGTNTVAGASISSGTSMFTNDMGSQCGYFSRTNGTGGTSVSFTTTSNNASWAWGGVVFEEVVAAGDEFVPVPGPGLSPWGDPQPWLGTEDIPGANVSVDAENASVSFVAQDGSPAVSPNADDSILTLVANDGKPGVSPSADVTTISFSANNPTVDVRVNAGVASISFSSTNATPSVASNTDAAQVIFSSDDAEVNLQYPTADWSQTQPGLTPFSAKIDPWLGTETVAAASPNVNVFPEVATVSFTSNNTTGSVNPNAGNASVAFSANNTTPSVSPAAGNTSIVFSANNGLSGVAPNAGVSAVSLAANNSVPSLSVNAQVASVSFIAQDAQPDIINGEDVDLTRVGPGLTPLGRPQPWMGSHVFVSPDVNVSPTSADLSFSANNPSKSISVNAGVATLSMTANDVDASIRDNSGSSGVSVVANQPTAAVSVNAGVASIAFTTNNVTAKADISAGVANVAFDALPATIPSQFVAPADLVVKLKPDTVTTRKRSTETVRATKQASSSVIAVKSTDQLRTVKHSPELITVKFSP